MTTTRTSRRGVAWRGVALRGVALRCVAWRGVALRCVALHCVAWRVALSHNSDAATKSRNVSTNVRSFVDCGLRNHFLLLAFGSLGHGGGGGGGQ